METQSCCGRGRAVCLDLVKLAPTTSWLIMCLVAIPAYAAIGWVTPVVCAVFSSVLGILATRDILQFLAPNVYALVGSLQDEATKLTIARARRRGAVAVVFFAASAACCVIFLCIAYVVIEPEKSDMPCDGECEDCEEDNNCKRWVRGVEEDHSVVAICPPTRRGANTDATFSCLADGYWMLMTSLIGLVWVGAAYCIVRKARTAAAGAAGPGATEMV